MPEIKPKRRSPCTKKTVEERFWPKVDRSAGPDGCWIWTASKNLKGYGQISSHVRNKPFLAHRVSYEIANGAIPSGMYVCHSCDNPPCVNPSHLWLGTLQDNIADATRKGRIKGTPRYGEANPTAKLSDAQAMDLYRRIWAGEHYHSLALEFRVSDSLVWMIKNGHCRKSLSEADDVPQDPGDAADGPGGEEYAGEGAADDAREG
jgi:hypothetical protein